MEIEIESKNDSFNTSVEISGETIELLPFQTTFLENEIQSTKNVFEFLCVKYQKLILILKECINGKESILYHTTKIGMANLLQPVLVEMVSI
ncbi:phage tail protein [Campylobacter jejuni subsp. doylei]|uniref:Phage tail protein n=1 Tax=Campylobacter jejuni subsp. doylei TaxID=32021 RepID=A0A3S4U4A7_CAMJU|nr:phage tail protein [Campylobacter jejuni subsp. doylei]